MDKDYVILMNQKTDINAMKDSGNQIEENVIYITKSQADIQVRLDNLYSQMSIQNPIIEPNEKKETCSMDNSNLGRLNITYEELFQKSYGELIDKGINPNKIVREEFLDEKTLNRIDEDASIPLYRQPQLDKYDYMISAFSGVVAGLVDIFLVGTPGNSILSNVTDTKTNYLVMKFAKKAGWNPREGNESNVRSAIGFLEKKFPVNYDMKSTTDVGNMFDMGTKNHHLKSLAHSPSLLGMFFSVLDQFQGKASFFSDGQLIRIDAESMELRGGNLIAKIFCGIGNWFGHLMSDVAGSSGAIGRGSGIPMPLYNWFLKCDIGSFTVGKDKQDLAVLMTRVFQEGYDARFGAAMAIPVVINELVIRLSWAIKTKFYHKKTWKESIPIGDKPELRRMLLIGQGCLCIVDSGDALIKSGGNALTFVLNLNLVAWCRFAFAGFKEIRICCVQDDMLDTKLINENIDKQWDALYSEIVVKNDSISLT